MLVAKSLGFFICSLNCLGSVLRVVVLIIIVIIVVVIVVVLVLIRGRRRNVRSGDRRRDGNWRRLRWLWNCVVRLRTSNKSFLIPKRAWWVVGALVWRPWVRSPVGKEELVLASASLSLHHLPCEAAHIAKLCAAHAGDMIAPLSKINKSSTLLIDATPPSLLLRERQSLLVLRIAFVDRESLVFVTGPILVPHRLTVNTQ